MFSTPIDTYTTSLPLATRSRSFFETLEQYIVQAQFTEAQYELFALFRNAQSEDEVQCFYQFLFELLPHCTSLGLLENNLPNLLGKSASFVKEQEQLALLLARRYLQERELKKAMLCFAKALQMNRSQDNYRAALEVFLHYFQTQKEQRLDGLLINPTPSPDAIASHLKTIEALKTFGIPKEDLIPFFQKIAARISHVPSDKHAAYIAHEQAALDLRGSFWEPQKTAIERYWEALETFRECFGSQDTRTVQKKTFHAMKQLIALCIEDICTLIGPPPCHYDLRAMGSLGREEMCPYSDLECMLLIENEQYLPYFTRMLELLELQIVSLGETESLNFVFTCLSNRSGLHLDHSPFYEQRLMQTPEQMAKLQKRTTYAGNDIECTVLKTASLHQSTPQLYIDYRAHLQHIRKEFPFPFFDLCSARTHDFSLAWKQHFNRKTFKYNIKETFVETLYHPLSDLALYCGIESTNTLEIADALIERKVLPEEMRDLLKESVSLIYQIRVRTHRERETQEEETHLIPEEIAVLEQCYWRILIPLHTCLKKLAVPKEPHRQFFEELCKIDNPQVLITQLKGAASILDAVLHLPDPSTTRPIYTMKIDVLQASIAAITDSLAPSTPGETSVQIKAPHFLSPRTLRHSFAKKIMEGLNLKKEYTTSAHRVCRLQYGIHDLHLKQTPSNPLMEYAIHSLVSRIAGEYTPPTTLVRFDVEQQGQKKSYPVLISQTIPGENLKTAWPKAAPNRSYTWNLLVVILTKPQDGRLPNYILHKQDIFCIDNDLSFVEPITITRSIFGVFRTVHFSAAPFCLFPLDTPLDQEVLMEFAALDAIAICKAWVEEVIQKEKEYLQLFTEGERKILYEKESCTLSILLKEGTFSTLNLQFWQLQNAIRAAINQNTIVTAGDLLQQLISLTEEQVGDYVYRAYHNSQPTPERKLQAALSRRQDSSVTVVKYHKNCLGEIPSFDQIEKLKKYSLQEASHELFHASSIEPEHAYLKYSQRKNTLEANFKELKNPIREAKILLFINELMKRSPQKILSLSFYYSTLLDTYEIESFLRSALNKIDLRHCSNVDNATVWVIQKKCPHLKELILTGCPKVTGFWKSFFFPRLTFTHLETLEISHTPCSNLVFTAPKLRFLNISHNPELLNLDFEAPSLLEINTEKSTKIRLSPSAREHAIRALTQTQKNLAIAPLELVNDWKIVMAIITRNGLALEYAKTRFKKNKQIVLTAVQQNGYAFEYASEELKSDRKFVLAAVQQNGKALKYASEELKNDGVIVFAAVQQNGQAFEYASKEYKSNIQFMLSAVQKDVRTLEYVSEELKSDRKLVLTAVQKDVRALQYASEELKSDREFVLAAMLKDIEALKYASEELKSNREFVLATVKLTRWALDYAAEELKCDKEIVLTAVRNGYTLKSVSEELKSNREFMLGAIWQNGAALQFASEKLKSDKVIVLAAVRQCGLALRFASEELKSDKEIVLAAVKQDGLAFNYVAKELKSDKVIVLAAVRQRGLALQFASEELKSDREFVLAAVQRKGLALQFVSEELKSDKEIVLAAVRQNGLALRFAAEELKSDKEIVLAAVQQDGQTLEYASKELKSDKEIVLAAVQQDKWALKYAAEELKSNKEIVLSAMRNGYSLEYVSEELKSNREFMLAAVQQDGLAFTYAAKELKSDREFMLPAVQQKGWFLEYASKELKSDKEIVLAAVQQNGRALNYAAKELKSDKEVVLAAVRQNGQALLWASEELKTDTEIVLVAVQQDGLALKYAAKELKGNKEIMLAAVWQNKLALEYTAEKLKSDREFVLANVQRMGQALQFASEELKSDKEIVLAAVRQDGRTLNYAAEQLKSDTEIVLAAVRQDGRALNYAAEQLKSDTEIVLAAVRQDGRALKYAAEELRSDKEIVLAAVQQDGLALEYAAKELNRDKKVLLATVRQNRWALFWASKDLKSDRKFMLAAVQQNGEALQFAAEELKSDTEIVLAAVRQNGWALQFASEELKSDAEIVLAALRQDGVALVYAPEELKSDREIGLAAVQQDGWALRFVAKGLKSDREIVLTAVQKNGDTLQFVTEELKSDTEIVLAAVQQNGKALKYAAEELRNDKEIVLAAVQQDGLALEYAAEKFKSDTEIVLAAVQQNGLALKYAAEELNSDKEVVLAALKQNGWALNYAAEEFKSDTEIVLAAVKQNGWGLQFATKELKNDKEIRQAALEQNPMCVMPNLSEK